MPNLSKFTFRFWVTAFTTLYLLQASITTFTTRPTYEPCNRSMDYIRSEFTNIDNIRCRCPAATMNLVGTPLSRDLKKLSRVWRGLLPHFLYAAEPMIIMYTLRCKLLAWVRLVSLNVQIGSYIDINCARSKFNTLIILTIVIYVYDFCLYFCVCRRDST